MENNYSAAFLVLLYGKEISASETLNSIRKQKVPVGNNLLVIWNNGPELLQERHVSDFELLGFDVVIRETITNESLSKIYNQFITNYASDKYIILDDDSQLNQNYIDRAFNLTTKDIGVPQIFSGDKQTFPKKIGNYALLANRYQIKISFLVLVVD